MNREMYVNYFKGKKVTKMGLGPNGRSFGDTLFLIKNGAHVLVTDYREGKDLEESKKNLLAELTSQEQERVSFIFGEHLEQDFIDTDFVLKASGVPLDSPYVLAAEKAGVPVHSSSAWLFSLLQEVDMDVTTIGVTGTKGKSTVTDMIEHIMKENGMLYHVAGNIRGVANLPVLEQIKSGDILLAELDSWQLQGFGEAQISPQVSVFTNFFEDHLDYYGGSMELYFKDKAQIYKNQKDGDICFISEQANKEIEIYEEDKTLAAFAAINLDVLPEDLVLRVLGDHNRQNAALAYSVAMKLNIPTEAILETLESYSAMNGRLQLVGTYDGVTYYDDNNSTTPTSTLKSLESIKQAHPQNNVIWLGGGADKEFDYTQLAGKLSGLVDGGILFAGAATDKIIELLPSELQQKLPVVNSMNKAWEHIESVVKVGDVIVLSPGAASFGVFLNEYERGDQFNEYIKNIAQK